MRICYALGEKPNELAENIGIEWSEFRPLITGSRGQLSDADFDPVWININNYVGHRMGMLMAVKEELNRKTQADRAKRAARLQRHKNYDAEQS